MPIPSSVEVPTISIQRSDRKGEYRFDGCEEESRDGDSPCFHSQIMPIEDSLLSSREGFLNIRMRDNWADTNLGVLGAPRCQSSKSFAFTVCRTVGIDRLVPEEMMIA
jgi:hypothetical protein